MNRDMFYFSDVQHRHIIKIMDDFEEKDPILVSCQQMLETLLKGLILEKFGEVKKTHNLKILAIDLGLVVSSVDRNMLGELTSIYFNNRYASDDYIDYNIREYREIVDFSLKLRDELVKLKKNKSLDDSNKFGGD